MDQERERAICATWKAGGAKLWNPATNGLGEPLLVDGFEYRLERRDIGGREAYAVVCKGVVVEVSP